MKFPAQALQRLARRVRDGDVVFFIGTGFSVDSEGNTANRLMRRLLVRLQAMCEQLGQEGAEVAEGFVNTFGLKPEGTAVFRFPQADVDKLADKYYEANEWFCRAFGRLLSLLKAMPEGERNQLRQAIQNRERTLVRTGGPKGEPLDPVELDELRDELLAWLHGNGEEGCRHAGKALFLDTMGFRHPGIMGGNPGLPRADQVAESYERKLFPRHHVIARFAREGFCGTTLTTNYDLLLEGAFRIAGFGYERAEPLAAPSYFHEFARVASPAEFFTMGKSMRTPTVVKMHGCVEHYREQAAKGRAPFWSYLRSMVFTYREIQNWRTDSWAADYLRTLLRTRTVVFSGYSLRDPVIHDTFRTVYEEMARERGACEREGPATARPVDAPAFFITAVRDMSEFYGLEVLRAASAAVGARTQTLLSHPNYLQFHFRSKPEFPHLDEVYRWLFHAVFRLRQWDCLRGDLARVLGLLLGKPRPEQELAAARRAFRLHWLQERRAAERWTDAPADCQRSRRQHAAICGWTDGFGAALLREFACTDHVHRHRGPDRQFSLMRSLPWHCPTTQNNGWTCWAAVVELALRRMTAAFSPPRADSYPELEVRGVEGPQPTVLFPTWRGKNAEAAAPDSPSDSTGAMLPTAVTLRYRGLEVLGKCFRLWGQVRLRVFWELYPGDSPWPLAPRGAESDPLPAVEERLRGEWSCRAPHAGVIWRWACGQETALDRRHLRVYLGGDKEHA